MKNFKRILVTVVSALLLMAVTVAGTLAYLQATTDAVVNTFTYGKVNFAGLGLDEAKVDDHGVEIADAGRVKANEYKLLPGQTYIKDPTVHIEEGSEPCWVFIKVENGIYAIEDAEGNTIKKQILANNWVALEVDENGNGVYYYKDIINGLDDEANLDLVIFENFKLTDSLDETAIETYKTAQILIDAYLIQYDNLTTVEAAWAAAAGAGFDK